MDAAAPPSNRRFSVLYGALALAVAAPLLRPGYVLSVDLAQTPRSTLSPAYWGLPSGTNSGSLGRLPFDALLRLAGEVGAVAWLQKLLLLAIVFLAGLGMHRLADAGRAGRTYAGVLYAINPFVYERLLAGQWFLLLAYALIPWGYAAFRADRVWRFAAVAAVAGFADAHMAALLLGLCAVTLAVRPGRTGLVALVLAVLASLLWLLPTPGLGELWASVGHEQLSLYATAADPQWGLLLTVLGLGGFWENPDSAVFALAVWPLFGVLFAGLALRGAALHPDRRVALVVAGCAVVGVLAALGTASGLTRPATLWLMDHVAALRSFRETGKALALVAFAYAFLGARAVDEVASGFRRPWVRTGFAVLAAAVPVVYAGRMLGGAWGDLHAVSFPASWKQADRLLPRDSRTLFLPFHGYLNLGFARSRVVYNPAPGYFAAPILAGRSVDDDPDHQDTQDPEQDAVRALLARPSAPGLARGLARLGVSRILLAHEADWRRLAVLEQRTDLRVVRRWPSLTLLALRRPGAPVMTPALAPVPARRESPVTLRLRAPAGRVVLGVAGARDWRRSGAVARFAPWPTYRRVYVLALLGGLIVVVAGLVTRLRRR